MVSGAKNTGFTEDAKLLFFEDGSESSKKEMTRRLRTEFGLAELCGRLNLPDSKLRQAEKLYEQVDTQRFDALVLAGCLVHIVSRKEPVMPRWKKLVAEHCRQLGLEENRLMKRYSDLYWSKNLRSGVNRLKKNGLSLEHVTALDYTDYIFNVFETDEVVRNFVNRRVYMLTEDPEWQSKSNVGIAGALLYLGEERHGEDEVTFEELSQELCLEADTFEDYVEQLSETRH